MFLTRTSFTDRTAFMTLNHVQTNPIQTSRVAVLAEDLRKTYKGGVTALDGLGFEGPVGGVFALLGPNGAGKSTTLLTGRENLVLQARVFGLRRPDQRARVDELLAHFDLEEAADRLVRGYSGGMRRRLDLAVGLMGRAGVRFLEAPTT